RAHARVVASEMHAGFVQLRRAWPMNLWHPPFRREPTPEVTADIRRTDAMWEDCRARFGRSGPFLFGGFSAADAMYAPVVARFTTYGADLGAISRTYMQSITELPAW